MWTTKCKKKEAFRFFNIADYKENFMYNYFLKFVKLKNRFWNVKWKQIDIFKLEKKSRIEKNKIKHRYVKMGRFSKICYTLKSFIHLAMDHKFCGKCSSCQCEDKHNYLH